MMKALNNIVVAYDVVVAQSPMFEGAKYISHRKQSTTAWVGNILNDTPKIKDN